MDVSAELDMDEARKRQLVDATINNEIEVVVNMIEADLALIDHRVNRRSTLLSIAAQYGHEDLARYFISKGCPVNAHCGTQVAALVWAARLQDGVGMIKLLVNAGARVKAYPRERSWCVSPLHEAARLKRAGNCLCLTELGADPEVRMGGNLTAYEMAGVSSQASKNMREGVRRWEVRGLVDKLHQLACLKEGSETGISCSTRAVLDRRRTAGKPLPCLTFPEEASSRKRGTKDSPKQERHRAFAALMRTLFEKVDHDVRCEVVSCI